ncbi:MAG: hypothetical protein ACTHJ5_12530 [Ilyomonas sp.]
MFTSTNITLRLKYPCSMIYSTIIHLSTFNKNYKLLSDSSYDCVQIHLNSKRRNSVNNAEGYCLYVFMENEANETVKLGLYIPKAEYRRDPTLYLEAYKLINQFTSDLQHSLKACNN